MIKNNRGATILEIVIAIAILAAISIPIARAIVSSSKYNYESRVRENLTRVAESLMENFKAYSIEEMQKKFDKENYNDWLLGCAVDDSTSFEVKSTTKDAYEFSVNSIKVGNVAYDMKATVTPVSKYQNLTLTTIEDFDKVTCAFAEISDNQESANNAIINDFKANYAELFLNQLLTYEKIFIGDKALTVNDIDYSYVKLLGRTINIYISKNDENYCLYYEIKYEYDMKGYPYNIDEEGNTGYFDYGEFECVDKSGQTFYTNADSADLQRVFVYYYPVYVNRNGDEVTDNIVLINSEGMDLDLYLLKQSDPDLGLSVATYEQSYCPYVSKSGNGNVNIYHNLQKTIDGNFGNDYYTSRIYGFKNGSGKSVSDAIKTEDNTLLYNVDIEIKKDEEVWARLSSTIKK